MISRLMVARVVSTMLVPVLAASPRGSALDVKKSSYKKLSKFLAVKQSEGLLKVKELTKGVESIIDIDFDHDQ